LLEPAWPQIIALYAWIDGPKGLLLGLYMTTLKGQKLDGRQPLASLSTANGIKISNKADLASGILLGVTALVRDEDDPTSPGGIMGISLNFMQVPSSTALAVDMPWINIDDIVFRCASGAAACTCQPAVDLGGAAAALVPRQLSSPCTWPGVQA
jgi:hypothetical protein